MLYKNFRFRILLHALLVVLLSLALAFVMVNKPTFFLPLVIGLALIATVASMVRYIEKSSRDLAHFLLSIRQGAFMESFTSGSRGRPHAELSDAMNEVVRGFAKLNLEKEQHYQYLEALNQHIGVAILSFASSGKLVMMNPAARRLLGHSPIEQADDLRKIDPRLAEAVKQVRPEERLIVKTWIGDEPYQLGIQVNETVVLGNALRIVLLQNLSRELEAKEIEAWQQLTRVLTHEIMNSVTPIASLSEAVRKIVTHDNGSAKELSSITDDNREDIVSSLATISSRSKGLLTFVKAYKDYARPPELHLQPVDLTTLVKRISDLLLPDLRQAGIDFVLQVPPTFPIHADPVLMEQVVINLIRNAMEAVPDHGTGEIVVEVKRGPNGRTRLSVADNGRGIDAETLPKIFIPFFTTRPKGTGIGLSLSQQIMKMHNGSIRVQSEPGKGSVFVLEW